MTKQAHDKSSEAPVDQHLSWIDAACREFLAAHPTQSSGSQIVSPSATASDDSIVARVLAKALPGYRIESECQRGGQGVVFRSTHLATNRDVAIKVLNETSAGKIRDRARFEREIRILGQLRHPNIVRVVDSGSADGRFYYIMEYVKGLPLDDYVLKNDLSIRDALILFAKVCDAVNVAHLRGIIHRDIKPSNIRVDPSGEPHVMDFGLAKVDEFDAIADPRTEVQTVAGQFVGTLPWASPEQLESTIDDLDIRTDVYSLGVVLYQIVARQFPYEVSGSVRRVFENICSIDPPKPSTVNAGIDDDVDCIVLKSLRKNREQRYQNAGNLAREIRRYLDGEPIDAKRDNSWYVLRKTIRRHRGKAFTVGLIALLVVQALVGMILMFQQEAKLRAEAETARDEATAARDLAEQSAQEAVRQAHVAESVNAFLNDDLLAAADPEIAIGRDISVRSVLDQASLRIEDRFQNQPLAELRIRNTLAEAYHNLGEYESALTHYLAQLALASDRLGKLDAETLSIRNNIALCLSDSGQHEKARNQIVDTLADLHREHGDDHPTTISTTGNLAMILVHLGEYDEALTLYNDVIERSERINGRNNATTISTRMNLADVHSRLGANDKSREHLEIAITSINEVYPEGHPKHLVSRNNLAGLLRESGELDAAIKLYSELYETGQRVLGPEHPHTLDFLNSLAGTHHLARNLQVSIDIWKPLLETQRRLMGNDHEDTLTTMNNLANALADIGHEDEARDLYVAALEGRKRAHGPEHPSTIVTMNNLAVWYRKTGRYVEGESLQREVVDKFVQLVGADHVQTMTARSNLGELLNLMRKFEEARKQNKIVADIADHILPNDHWFAGLSLRRLGESLTGLESFENAEELLLQSEKIVSNALGESSDRHVRCIEALVNLYDAWLKPDEAARWQEKIESAATDH